MFAEGCASCNASVTCQIVKWEAFPGRESHPDDVILLAKQYLGGQHLAQAPLVHLPAGMMDGVADAPTIQGLNLEFIACWQSARSEGQGPNPTFWSNDALLTSPTHTHTLLAER